MPYQIRKSVAQQIVDTVKEVCGQDVNFIDRSGVIFASTDNSRIGDYHEIGRAVVRSGETIEVEPGEDYFGTREGVNIPLVHHGETIAVIGITGLPNEVRKYAQLAQRITGLILREQELDAQMHSERAQMNHVIRALILEEPLNYEYFMDFMTGRGIDPESNYVTVVVRLNETSDAVRLSRVEGDIFRTFEKIGSRLYTFLYPNEYILLVREVSHPLWAEDLRALTELHPTGLQIGIGSTEALGRQGMSYQAAHTALASLTEGKSMARFDDLDLDILLASLSVGAKARFLKKTAPDLREKDRELLTVYFTSGMSLKRTGEALYMHKNTLQYQLVRIWRETGYNPRTFTDAVILYLGIKLRKSCQKQG